MLAETSLLLNWIHRVMKSDLLSMLHRASNVEILWDDKQGKVGKSESIVHVVASSYIFL